MRFFSEENDFVMSLNDVKMFWTPQDWENFHLWPDTLILCFVFAFRFAFRASRRILLYSLFYYNFEVCQHPTLQPNFPNAPGYQQGNIFYFHCFSPRNNIRWYKITQSRFAECLPGYYWKIRKFSNKPWSALTSSKLRHCRKTWSLYKKSLRVHLHYIFFTFFLHYIFC